MDLEKVLAELKVERERINETITGLEQNVSVPEDRIAHLKSEREQLEQAIMTVERLAQDPGPRRGRPVLPPPNPDPSLPPGAAMCVPQPLDELVWAVSGRKRAAS